LVGGELCNNVIRKLVASNHWGQPERVCLLRAEISHVAERGSKRIIHLVVNNQEFLQENQAKVVDELKGVLTESQRQKYAYYLGQ